MQALGQAHADIKIQSEREKKALRQIIELEEFLEDHRNVSIHQDGVDGISSAGMG
ncbi:hypothetical protein KAM344_41570 [Aeromonas caviae]|nr:hypothetical protein KAM344_41570 [Aeromonas caviae]